LKRHAEFEGSFVGVESIALPALGRQSGTAWLADLEIEVSQVVCRRGTKERQDGNQSRGVLNSYYQGPYCHVSSVEHPERP